MKCFKNVSVFVDGMGMTTTDLSFDEKTYAIGKSYGDEIKLPAGAVVLPGFIDIHVHGAGGGDVMDAASRSLDAISTTLAEEGTTGFLATTMTQSEERITAALSAVSGYCGDRGARLLGVHLEGPFISRRYKGAQSEKYVRAPSVAEFEKFQQASGGKIKVVTIAPETEGAMPFIEYLTKNGVVVSVGHSAATGEEVKEAIKHGAKSVTHTFNAQSPFAHRQIGLAGSALLFDELNCEIIVDGIHVSYDAVKLFLKCKPADKIILITDAMRAKGCGDCESELGGQQVFVKDGQARLADGTLAGSVLKMNCAVKNMVENAGVCLERAVDFASTNPAKLIGVFNETGSIACGKRADYTVLAMDFSVLCTIVNGKIVYSAL